MVKTTKPQPKISELQKSDRLRALFNLKASRLKTGLTSSGHEKKFMFWALGVLFATTVFWSLLSAKLQQNNADQLVNAYQFKSSTIFHQSTFSGAHSFLIKWPIFWLISLLGASASVFISFSVGLSLVTVGALAAILYKIEKRPLIFGTLCLGLASALMLIPAQPYAGALLPVNMAMIATRNIEYIIYVASLALLLKSNRLKSKSFWLAAVILAVLVASDKLFMDITLGGAAIGLVVYALSKGWNLVSLSVDWLIAGLLSAAGATGLLWLINSDKIAHISAQSSSSPYAIIHSPHDLVIGALFAVMGFFTNFGANPAFNATVARTTPSHIYHGLVSFNGVGYAVNFLVVCFGLFVAIRLIQKSLSHNRDSSVDLDTSSRLSIMLIWSSLAAIVLFVGSKHYYAVDARYLSIALFTVFIAIATYTRQRTWTNGQIRTAASVLIIGIVLAIPGVLHIYNNDQAALRPINQRNQSIADILLKHKAKLLVGDYWRVMPIKLDSGNKLNVTPLDSCTTNRQVLSSQAWQPDLNKQGFAYLLTLDGSLTGYRPCTLDQIIKAYGRPNNSVLIAGTQDKPKELLLYYDKGAKKSAPKVQTVVPGTVLPISLSVLPYTNCPSGTTVMNIVAHQDDDLLFINPDTVNAIKAGHCVRTVYLTAGDSGSGSFYWLQREQGSEAAYSQMLGSNSIWVQRIVKLANNEYVMVAHPQSDYRVSLIFMRLPDGNINGQGFRPNLYESLAKLYSGSDSTIYTVDNQSSYTSSQLVSALAELMKTFQPTEIRTQADYVSKQYPDHSDHITTGAFTKKAYAQYDKEEFEDTASIPIKYYIGYPIHAMPTNISGSVLQQKEAIFFAYAQFDSGVCKTIAQCNSSTVYGEYLTRQYQNSN